MAQSRRVRFGVFEVDLATGDIQKGGLPVRLRGRPFEVLAQLLERPGELVTRDELRQRLWPADTFVDFDHGLNTSINRLREALGDSADSPRFVETLPRRGYRFVTPVTPVADTPPARVEAAPDEPGPPEPPPASRGVRPIALSLAIAAALAVAGYLAFGRGVPAPSGSALSRVAVLPFRNVSGDPGQEYFADGLTDALIAQLAQVKALRVISRTSVMAYKSAARRLPEIGRELGVDAVVEGSILRSGDRVRITAELVDAAADRQLWAESYERGVSDILAIQSEVARAITRGIRVTVTPQETARLARPSSVRPEAYEAYLRGRFFWQAMTADGFRKSIEYLNQAIAADPDYAPAYAALADSYWIMGTSGFEVAPQGEVAPKARAAAARALELDPNLPAALATLAMVEIDYEWDWASGGEHLRRAIALNPSLADAHVTYSAYLTGMGRFDAAVAEARRALELDPLSVVAGQTLGFRLFYAGQFQAAIQQFRRTLELDPHAFVAKAGLAQSYWATGDRERALAEAERSVAESGGNCWVQAWLGYAAGASGDAGRAREVLASLQASSRLRYVPPIYPAMVYAGLGDRDRAIAALEQAFRDRSPWMLFLNVEPEFQSLRDDPRFVALLLKAGHRPGEKGPAPPAAASP